MLLRPALLTLTLLPLACANSLYVRGRVTMEDGSPPDHAVLIERHCDDSPGFTLVVHSNRKGEYVWTANVATNTDIRVCVIRASLPGFQSNLVDISNLSFASDPNLQDLVLKPIAGDPALQALEETTVPKAVQPRWSRALKDLETANWDAAATELHAAVQIAPKFAQGWNALGTAYLTSRNLVGAKDAYQHAIEADPKLLAPYLPLARLCIQTKDWSGAIKAADALIAADAKRQYPEVYLHQAVARYQLKDLDGAGASANEMIRLDRKHEFPRAEYILGRIFEAKGDYDGARDRLARYLDLEPKAFDAALIRVHMQNLGQPGAEGEAELEPVPGNQAAARAGEAWVPGGMKALAAVAHLDGEVTYQNFFADYCRALVREFSVGTSQGIPKYLDTLRAYMAAVAQLEPLGERRGDHIEVTLSLATDAQRRKAAVILPLLGWKLSQKDGTAGAELGDQPADGPRQQIPALFGVDEIAMQETLASGGSVAIDIPTDSARLIATDAWADLVKELPALPGGFAAAFTTDLRMAKAYAGLGAMGPDAAAALLSTVRLRTLVTRYADVLGRYGEAFAVDHGRVGVPGGAPAEAVWKKLAGASPREPGPFFRALLVKPDGALAAFYWALWQADAAHQRFFTKTESRAERVFAWYRSSDGFQLGVVHPVRTWRTGLFQDLPLDADGGVRFPGGRKAWTTSMAPDDEVLASLGSLEALVPLARLEEKRKKPLDETSARLLAQHYAEWRPLFPYFEKLAGLAGGEFTALAAFENAVSKTPAAEQNAMLGEWHSLLDLIARGAQAGSLDAAQSARAFRRICERLSTPDHSARALEALREIAPPAGEAGMREAVAGGLLRLSGARRSAFERVLELQRAPSDSGVATLTGFVYAAALDPDALLLNEDPGLLSKHQFAKRAAVFGPTALNRSSTAPGSFLSGGFGNLEEIGRGLVRSATAGPAPAPVQIAASSGPAELDAVPEKADFHADARLVEVWATVTDSRGRYVDDLSADQFAVLEQQASRPVLAFESQFAAVSCVLLLDTTGSMDDALPALKSAALKLVGDLRAEDSVAVYSFNDTVTELQPFTTDKSLAKRAVLKTHAFGNTAIYDALARVSRDLSGRTGKKVIVLFTDGNDNASTLMADTAILRAKASGVPVYTIAQGEALGQPAFLKLLAAVSKATGGESFAIHDPGEIGSVFEKVSQDLAHGYLLTFKPDFTQERSWRSLEVVLKAPRGRRVRSREGFYPE